MEGRWRYTDAFTVNSGVFESGRVNPSGAGPFRYPPVPVNNQFDVQISKRFENVGKGIIWSLNVQNIFDNKIPDLRWCPGRWSSGSDQAVVHVLIDSCCLSWGGPRGAGCPNLAFRAQPREIRHVDSACTWVTAGDWSSWCCGGAAGEHAPVVRTRVERRSDAVEFDVRVSGDGVAVVHHDATTRRTCGVDMIVEKRRSRCSAR